jgi:hypothetical protein
METAQPVSIVMIVIVHDDRRVRPTQESQKIFAAKQSMDAEQIKSKVNSSNTTNDSKSLFSCLDLVVDC